MRTLRRLLVLPFRLAAPLAACGEAAAPDGPPGARPAATVEPAALEAPVPPPDSTTARLFREVMAFARAERLHERPTGEIMQAVGEHFAGTPYAAGLLDAGAEETLVCTLNGFDCVTFVETAFALARGIRAEDYGYDTFAAHLQDARYRGGKLDGYCSRMHYFSEWIAENEARGLVENVTERVGGEPLDKTLTFMTGHRDAYPRLTDDALFACIEEMEANLEGLELFYIPQDRIREAYGALRAGDIVALATSIRGLDVSHTGLVYDGGDGRRGLLHASTSGGVVVSPDLQGYVQNNAKQIGIVVARPQEP